MDKEVYIAAIGAIGTLASPVFGYLGRRLELQRRPRTADREGASRPVLVFFVWLSTGLAITALTMALIATRFARLNRSAIEISIVEDATTQNDSGATVFIAGACDIPPNGEEPREITGRMGPPREGADPKPSELPLVAAAQGTRLMSFSMIVPPGWYYRVRTASGPPCHFRGWKI